MSLIRLDKYLCSTGEHSRSEAKKLIKSGAVMINERFAVTGEVKVDPDIDRIYVKGVLVEYKENHYIMMNKPSGYLSATEDKNAKTVLDLMEPKYKKLNMFPAGRLDKDTEGLLLLTDDGDFCHNVISPSKDVKKVYYAQIVGQLVESDVTKFREGIVLSDGYRCNPAGLEIIGENTCLVTVNEGKFHQVKRMLMACNCQVAYLKRLKIGELELDKSLRPGEYRELTEDEIGLIFMHNV